MLKLFALLTFAFGAGDVGTALVLEEDLALVGAALGLVLRQLAVAVARVVVEGERQAVEGTGDGLRVQPEQRHQIVVGRYFVAVIAQAAARLVARPCKNPISIV